MRTLRTPQPISSADDNCLLLKAPTSWAQLSPEQWQYVLTMLTVRSALEVKVLMLLRFCGIGVLEPAGDGIFKCYHIVDGNKKVIYLEGEIVQQLIHTFDFIDGYEDYTVRLNAVGDLKPVDELLHGVTFIDYLVLDKLYNGFLRNRNNTALLERMGQIMFLNEKGESNDSVHFEEWQRLHVFLWFSYIKMVFAKHFPDFLQPASGVPKVATEQSVLSDMNIQIRALTGGDVTKEEQIERLDCWRALTELDAKAREAAETRKLMKKNKR